MARIEISGNRNPVGVLALWAAFAAVAAILVGSTIAAVTSRSAHALPAYTQQTGLPCMRCHTNPTGGPDLTDFGKEFQANGDKLKK
jgi:hypothetical protein